MMEKEKILNAFLKGKGQMTPRQAADASGVNRNTARWCCLRLYQEGQLERVNRGYYKPKK